MAELVSTDPCTGEVVWRGAEADAATVDRGVAAARAGQRDWAARPLADRIAVARAYADAVRADADGFARLISREVGKPFWEAKTEVGSVAGKIDISVTAQAERAGERHGEVAGIRQAVRHKPHGVLGVLGPFNFPAHLPNGHIVPALLAGNAVVFKPSEQAPATAEHMAALWARAGLPAGVLQIVQGRADTGRALAGHDGLDGLLFTGSARTGAALARAYADRPHKILAVEAGGNNPLVAWDVPPDQLDAAAAVIVQAAYLSAGQRCTCARRLIVQDALADALVERVLALVDRLIIGAPFADPQPFMGPVIDLAAADHLLAGFDALGGDIIRPLIQPDAERPFLTPALVDVTGVDTPDEELFGPVLQLVRAADWESAITAANATRFGLAASLLGGDRALYDRFWAESRAGVVNWNRPTNGAASNAPFGGVGLSGNHRPSAYYAADYCAWPVASLEADAPDGGIATGLRP